MQPDETKLLLSLAKLVGIIADIMPFRESEEHLQCGAALAQVERDVRDVEQRLNGKPQTKPKIAAGCAGCGRTWDKCLCVHTAGRGNHNDGWEQLTFMDANGEPCYISRGSSQILYVVSSGGNFEIRRDTVQSLLPYLKNFALLGILTN